MKDLISVVIPMYNAQGYIAKLLKCLKEQTYTNLEIVIVNDGSTDNSLQVVQECAKEDSRIKIISTPNGGVSKARNTCLENVTGDYITFLDADDYIELDMYEKLLAKLKEKDVDVVRCNYVKENENGEFIENGDMLDFTDKVLAQEDIRGKLLEYIFQNKIPTYTPLIFAKAECIKNKLTFNTNIRMMEDLLFCLELFFSIDKMYMYDFKTYHYVVNSSSSSKSRKNIIRNFNSTVEVVSILIDLFKKEKISDDILLDVYSVYSGMIAKYMLRIVKEDDEYKITKEQMNELLSQDKVKAITSKADYTRFNEYIAKAGKYIQLEDYDNLYDYGEKIREIPI